MDTRDRTLSALESYIASQTAFLSHTYDDIQRLRQLKEDVLNRPKDTVDNLQHALQDPSFKISHRSSELLNSRTPPNIEWDLLKSRNPQILHEFVPRQTPISICPPNPLSIEPNDLQIFVHDSAEKLFAALPPLSPSPSAHTERSLSPSLTALDKRLSNSTNAPTPLRRTTRKHKPKVVKEAASLFEVKRSCRGRGIANGRAASSSTHTLSPTISRHGSTCDAHESELFLSPARETTSTAAPLRSHSTANDTQLKSSLSESYNKAWSIEEQHLLEKLLIEIPKGEKHRWARISHEMQGRRTPRQVASRVQKFFEKLRKAGLDHPG